MSQRQEIQRLRQGHRQALDQSHQKVPQPHLPSSPPALPPCSCCLSLPCCSLSSPLPPLGNHQLLQERRRASELEEQLAAARVSAKAGALLPHHPFPLGAVLHASHDVPCASSRPPRRSRRRQHLSRRPRRRRRLRRTPQRRLWSRHRRTWRPSLSRTWNAWRRWEGGRCEGVEAGKRCEGWVRGTQEGRKET